MPLYEKFGPTGDEGMLVAGIGVDDSFRAESDAHGNFADRLITVPDYKELLEEDALRIATQGVCDHLNILANPDQ